MEVGTHAASGGMGLDRGHAKLCAIALVASFGARLLCQLSAVQVSGMPTMWPGSAVLLGLCLVRGHGRREVLALGVGAALAVMAWRAGALTVPAVLLETVATFVSAFGAFFLVRRFTNVDELLDGARGVGWFIAACAMSSAGAALFTSLPLLATPAGFTLGWLVTFASALLGLLVVTPIVVILARPDAERGRPLGGKQLADLAAVLALTGGIACLNFLSLHLPLLFLTFPAVLLATFRQRQLGAAAAVLLVALVTGYATAHGYGAIARSATGEAQRRLVLQVFLACCFLSALPIAAVVADRDRRSREAHELAQRFKMVVENIGEVIFQVDCGGRWVYLNPAWETLTGVAVADSLGRSWLEWVDQADHATLCERAAPVLAGERANTRRSLHFTTAHGIKWTELFVQRLCDAAGQVIGATGTLRDIDDRKRLEEHVLVARRQAEERAHEATLLASTDELTGLASRRAFLRQLDREIAGAAEFDWPLAVAIFDVDHFKAVNDRHGHTIGDRVLQQIARRAETVLRGGDLVGRIGGEEFAIIMPGATAADAASVAERLREAVEQRNPSDIGLPPVTVSIGIAEREGQRSGTALLTVADTALYQAKNAGRNRVRIAA